MPSSHAYRERFWTRRITISPIGQEDRLSSYFMVILEFCIHGNVRLGVRSLVFTNLPVTFVDPTFMSVPRGDAPKVPASIHLYGTPLCRLGSGREKT